MICSALCARKLAIALTLACGALAWASGPPILGAAAGPAAQDTIFLADGSSLRGGMITAAGITEVVYSRAGEEHKVPAAQIVEIRWGQVPDSFRIAISEAAKGDFASAASHFAEAAEATEREPIKHEATFRAARAQLNAAGTDAAEIGAALGQIEHYLSMAPNGLRVPEARLLQAQGLRSQDKHEQALEVLDAALAAAAEGGWSPEWNTHAQLERALTLLDHGQTAQARSAFGAVVSACDAAATAGTASADLDELRARAVVGKGAALVAEGKLEQAVEYFRGQAAKAEAAGSTGLRAAALAGAGATLLRQAEQSGESKTLREAQAALAQATVLGGVGPFTAAKALYYSGKVLLALGSEHEVDAKPRALGYFDTIVRLYPTTRWATLARAELAR